MKSLSLAEPHALIMVGISGSGKSHFAKKFADTFGAPLVQAETLAPHAADDEATTHLIRTFVNEIAKTKQSFIIDAGGSTKRDRAEFSKFLRESGYVPLFVWIQTDTETARQRSKRKKLSDEAFERALKIFTPLHSSENSVVLSGKHTYATQARVVLKRLSAPRADISAHRQPPMRPGTIVVQ